MTNLDGDFQNLGPIWTGVLDGDQYGGGWGVALPLYNDWVHVMHIQCPLCYSAIIGGAVFSSLVVTRVPSPKVGGGFTLAQIFCRIAEKFFMGTS